MPNLSQEGRPEAVATEVSSGSNQPTALAAIVGGGVDIHTLTQAPFVLSEYSGFAPDTRAHINFLPVTQAVINYPGQPGVATHRPTGSHPTRSQTATARAFGRVIEKRVGRAAPGPSAGTTGTADRSASTVFNHPQKLEPSFHQPLPTSSAAVTSNEAPSELRLSATGRHFSMAHSGDFDHAMGRERSSVANSSSHDAHAEVPVATEVDHDSNRTNSQDVCVSRHGDIDMGIDWGQKSQDASMGMPSHTISSGGEASALEEGFGAHGHHDSSALRHRLDDWGSEDPETPHSDFFNIEFELWLESHQEEYLA
jgi:hypothetical protein